MLVAGYVGYLSTPIHLLTHTLSVQQYTGDVVTWLNDRLADIQ